MRFRIRMLAAGFLLVPILLLSCQKEEQIYFQGYVESEFVYVASSGQGQLKSLFVAKGQSIRENAPLFQLDANPEALQIAEVDQRIEQARASLADISKGRRPSELESIRAQLARARTALDLARKEYQRRQSIAEAGRFDAISEEEFDRFQTEVSFRRSEVATLEAELKTATLGGRVDALAAANSEIKALAAARSQLEWQLAQKRVLAPSAATVQEVFYRAGEYVPAGRPVVSLLLPENLKIRFFIPQAQLPVVQLGTPVRVRLDGLAAQIRATVSYISPEAEFTPPIIYSRESRAKLVYMIEAIPEASASGQLRVGQPLEVLWDL